MAMKRELLLGSVAAFVATAALAQSPRRQHSPNRSARAFSRTFSALWVHRATTMPNSRSRLARQFPAGVELADVTETLRDIQPDWRGRKYFVVKNTVVIVDQNRKISAVLPVGDARAQVRGVRGSTVSGSTPTVQPLSGKAATPGTAGSTPGTIGTATTPSVAAAQQQQRPGIGFNQSIVEFKSRMRRRRIAAHRLRDR